MSSKLSFYVGNNKERGFTLIELLLAIFIFSIVISLVYGAYSSTFHLIDTTGQNIEIAGKAQATLERITDDLASIVTGEGGFFTGKQQDHSGARGDSMAFVSAVHLGLTRESDYAGYSTIQYSIESDEELGLLQLYRSGTRVVPGRRAENIEPEKYLLCDGLQEIRFSYSAAEGTESDEWLYDPTESADKDKGFPVMVTILLRFANSPESENVSVFTTSVAIAQGK